MPFFFFFHGASNYAPIRFHSGWCGKNGATKLKYHSNYVAKLSASKRTIYARKMCQMSVVTVVTIGKHGEGAARKLNQQGVCVRL